MDVGSMSYAQVKAALADASTGYKLEARNGQVTISVDGIYGSLRRHGRQKAFIR